MLKLARIDGFSDTVRPTPRCRLCRSRITAISPGEVNRALRLSALAGPAPVPAYPKLISQHAVTKGGATSRIIIASRSCLFYPISAESC